MKSTALASALTLPAAEATAINLEGVDFTIPYGFIENRPELRDW